MSEYSAAETHYFQRRSRLLRLLKNQIMIVTAAPEAVSSRDQFHPYFQNPNFFYLTGFEEPQSVLILSGTGRGPRSVLFLSERDSLHEKWDGEKLGLKRAKRRFRLDEVRDISNLGKDLPELLKGAEQVHYTIGSHPTVDDVLLKMLSHKLGPVTHAPSGLLDARVLLHEQRFLKDKQEISLLRRAAQITCEAFRSLGPIIREAKSELHCARLLEAQFAALGADGTSFTTIIASGKHATTLHHRPTHSPLWKRELVLIDAGARYKGYPADVTRTFPASGKFSPAQAAAYDVVLEAKNQVEKKIRAGITMDELQEICVRELTRGLRELRIISTPLPKAIADGEYKPFFMHRIGHYLGIDVHDIAPRRLDARGIAQAQYSLPLPAGCMITVEPGLYFDPRDQDLPKEFRGVGIRIEDDVLVTTLGCEVLTSAMPTSREAIEQLME